MKNLIKNFVLFFAVFIIIATLFSLSTGVFEESQRVGIQEFVNKIENGEVESVVVEGPKLTVSLKDGTTVEVKKGPWDENRNEWVDSEATACGSDSTARGNLQEVN